jgi:NTE family protein
MNGTKSALVMSGGGAYGAFDIGVMKVLYAGASPATGYSPLHADIFTGTSVGAFNATVMADQPDETGLNRVLSLERIWLNMLADRPGKCGNGIFRLRGNPADYVNPACFTQPAVAASRLTSDSLSIGSYLLGRTANFLASSAELSNRFLGLINTSSFIDESPYHDLLRQVIDEDRVRRSPRVLQVIATNWVTGQVLTFSNSDFEDDRGPRIIMASSAIPGFFPPVAIDDGLFVDGGAVENTPLNPAIEAGATDLHVIYLDPQPRFIPLNAEPNSVDTLLRVYYLMQASKLNEDIETARWINNGLSALNQYQANISPSREQVRDFVRSAYKVLSDTIYKPLTIHRYFPTMVLGTQLDLINFSLDRITDMIAEGERVALVHDCAASDCVLP